MVLLRTIAGCAQLTAAGVIVRGCAVAAIFELITILFRFGLGIQSTRDTAFIGALTFGIRIHHGYIGLLLMLIAAGVLRKNAGARHFFDDRWNRPARFRSSSSFRGALAGNRVAAI